MSEHQSTVKLHYMWGWVWWQYHTPIILALDPTFKASLGYKIRPCPPKKWGNWSHRGNHVHSTLKYKGCGTLKLLERAGGSSRKQMADVRNKGWQSGLFSPQECPPHACLQGSDSLFPYFGAAGGRRSGGEPHIC
jgi:hypothetical protein